MSKLTPQEFADKQARRLKAATQDIVAGIDRVTVAPGQQAVAKKDKLVQNWNAKINDGTWEQNTASVSLADWKNKFKNKGVQRIAAGIDEAKDKVTKFASQFLPHLDAVQAEVESMNDLTLEDSIARATHVIRRNAEFRFKK